jgi:PleD family two-component response regulator
MVNEQSGKPYYINVSVGVVEFDCEKGTDFQQLLDDADALLYEEKKNKKKVILKS